MLILHIGSQKTGTTALQGFLTRNVEALRRNGINYCQAARRNIAHNALARALAKDNLTMLEQLRDEIAGGSNQIHIVSSEMLFHGGYAPILADILSPVAKQVKVVAYLRRPDLYAEAMYKQKVKNGRIPPDPSSFLRNWHTHLRYTAVLDAYRSAFGHDAMDVRVFERQRLVAGDIIDDFLTGVGLSSRDGFIRSQAPANMTLSRAMSEQLGLVSRHTPFNARSVIREVSAQAPKFTIRSGDVFDHKTRARLLADLRDELDALSHTYFDGTQPVFAPLEPKPDPKRAYPSDAEALILERAATEAILESIGRQASAAPSASVR